MPYIAVTTTSSSPPSFRFGTRGMVVLYALFLLGTVAVTAFLPSTTTISRPHLEDHGRRTAMMTPSTSITSSALSLFKSRRSFVLHNSNDSNSESESDNEPIFYDDFEDFFPSGSGSASKDEVEESTIPSPAMPAPAPESSLTSSQETNDIVTNTDSNNELDSQLSKLLSQSKQKDVEKDVRLGRNWSSGNWKVRGFSLDKYNPNQNLNEDNNSNNSNEGSIREEGQGQGQAWQEGGRRTLQEKFANLRNVGNNTTDTFESSLDRTPFTTSQEEQPSPPEQKPINVCKIAFDETVLGFDDVTETIAVGRTDGSIYIIQLGSDYLTKFQAISTSDTSDAIQMDVVDSDEDDDDFFDPISALSSSSSSSSSFMKKTEMVREDIWNSEHGEDEPSTTMSSEELLSTPFEIVHQFYSNDEGEPITSLLFHDETLYTAEGSSGEIKVWSFDDSLSSLSAAAVAENYSSNSATLIPIQNLSNAHTDKVVVMKTLSNVVGTSEKKIGVNDHNLLLTASVDGSFALWSIGSGDLVYRCELVDDSGGQTSITCADVDTTGDEHFVYFGLSSGHVVGYAVSDLVGSASVGNECPVPSCRFIAHDPSQQKNIDKSEYLGVTAIACAGEGTSALVSKSMPSSNDSVRSTMVLTGGADGVVKQYEILRRKYQGGQGESNNDSPSWKLEHWPRLSTQRMKRHAHIFDGHRGSVTALASQSGSQILSASDDGTVRVWDQSRGIELYRMDGFEESVSSLCLDREILITDGMGNFVCVHDFDITNDEYKNQFELDW
eukprot:CAMPEP_0203684290 /NCGR_PEP_ID=MMETSP0090-20130426/47962_1 /ASSEMBLY_ACC=CAM_ASM_001088 /TAXON_ID=426623 /ORGANISM="Chaetoceros affinis, Strain CCMP159" /LENGTH=778 /DNA_ID=CAMNT_0050553461 /DNA_START=200 /DNA_END=2536 /DNA_ORIENTATION=+